ncbi:MAG: flagellar export protein FliJ [Phycisphaeraceae bacterium]
MARFTFKLEPVLSQRRRVEDEHRRVLARLLSRRMQMHHQLREMQESLSGDKQAMAQSLVGQVDVGRIRGHAAHNAQIVQRARGIVTHLADLEDQIAEARAALIQASQQRKAIELLRDRQHRRWKKKLDQREAAAMDEMATQRFGRGTGEAFS